MKTSLFKKEITKNVAGQVKAGAAAAGPGDPTTYQNDTIGMCPTARYNLFWGVISDSEFCTDTGTFEDVSIF